MATKRDKSKDTLKEMTDLLQRTQSSFENYRKQTEKRVEEIKDMSSKNVIVQILPILDNFELALKNTSGEKKDFVNGVELIYTQLRSLLETNNIETIETKGKMFDPYFHEALMKIASDLPEDSIVEELQKGFILQGKVIRHARVKISTGHLKE